MTFGSTRGSVSGISFSEAVLKGIAPDGGLFVPEQNVRFDSLDLSEMCEMTYKQLAARIFSRYATDFTKEEIEWCVDRAYGSGSRFDAEDPEPLTHLNRSLSVMELWHGPTAAFKDMALQVLPAFMSVALKKRRDSGKSGSAPQKIAILTATSGDTGKAALEGFKDAEGISIMVFYPRDGVSQMQKFQMITQEGGNVSVKAVRGNFDDAQTGVKHIFGDSRFCEMLREAGWELSSANSINFGRLLPQIVYYFHAYFTMVRDGRIKMGQKVNFAVPTGNFGNILAAYYAFKSGLPAGKLICATNSNSVVADFLRSGYYDANREFILTISPAMDILISSNLERLIYDMSGENAKAVSACMQELAAQGCYNVRRGTLHGIQGLFWADSASEQETIDTIAGIWKDYKYLIDPHTAVGIDVYDKYVISTGDMMPTVAVATASPFKFNRSVAKAVCDPEETVDTLAENGSVSGNAAGQADEFGLLDVLANATGCTAPAPLRGLDRKPVLHRGECGAEDMPAAVLDFLKQQSERDN